MRKIIEIVSTVTGISSENILAKNRNYVITDARKIAMSLCRDYTDSTWQAIGKLFKKDHSTVFIAHRQAKDYLCVDKSFASKYRQCVSELEAIGVQKITRVKSLKNLKQYKNKAA